MELPYSSWIRVNKINACAPPKKNCLILLGVKPGSLWTVCNLLNNKHLSHTQKVTRSNLYPKFTCCMQNVIKTMVFCLSRCCKKSPCILLTPYYYISVPFVKSVMNHSCLWNTIIINLTLRAKSIKHTCHETFTTQFYFPIIFHFYCENSFEKIQSKRPF